MPQRNETTDVIITGAGPVGLFLANELALQGIAVTVLERLTEQSQAIKAGGINGRTTQILTRRGLGDTLARVAAESADGFAAFAAGRTLPANPSLSRPRFDGHFAGIFLHAGPELPVPPSTVLPQQALETLLAARATDLGVKIHRGYELIDVETHPDAVRALATSNHGSLSVTGRYLVGCDGGRSTVRKLAQIAFPGTDPITTGYQAVADLENPEALPFGWFATDVGLYAHGPKAGRLLTVSFDGPPADRNAPVTLTELQDNIRHVSGHDVTITAVHSSTRYTDNIRQASTYREGRILLAGDAAHIHPPYGGQGLNTGLQDANNLGWKIAAVLRGDAEDHLLDTYTTERHPVGAQVLLNTRAQVALLRPDPRDRAMRELFRSLLDTVPKLADNLVSRLQGLDIRYDMGADNPHTMIGAFMPDTPGLSDAMRSGNWLLVSPDPDAVDPASALRARFGLSTLRAPLPDGATACLVRPDGFVAWATGAIGTKATEVETALAQWLTTTA